MPGTLLSPVQSYLATENEISKLLLTVTDNATAAAAAPQLEALATELRPKIRPFWLWMAQASSEEKTKFVQDRAMAAKAMESSPAIANRATELARQPGNEAFKAALASVYQAAIDEAPRVHAAQAQKQLDDLQK